MDHRTFLSDLPPDARAALTARSDRAGLARLAVHVGTIVALAVPVALVVPGWPLLLLPLGIALAFLFTLQHECTHQTPFATRWLNEVVGHACGLILVQPFLWFRAFHMAHHRFTNIEGKDPELDGGEKPQTAAELALHLSTLGYWRAKAAVLRHNAFGGAAADYVPDRAAPRIRTEARAMLVVYLAVAVLGVTVAPVVFRVWLLPLLLGFPVLRLYLLAEHGRCPKVADMFDNTRTTFTNALVRTFAWNMPYHAEHHVFPQVPFYRLPALHAFTRPHLRHTSDGYARFAANYLTEATAPGDGARREVSRP